MLDNNDDVVTLVDGTTRVDRLHGRDGPVIVLDLDASLTVTTAKSLSSIEEGNVICKEDVSCRWMYIAKQDIQEGEVLVLSEREVVDAGRWKLVGL